MNGTDVDNVTASAASFNWKAPSAGQFVATVTARNDIGDSQPTDVPLVSVDLRDVIDAMVFSSGPLSELAQSPSDGAAFIGWPNGIQLRVLFAPAVGARGRQLVQSFTNHYAEITNGAVTAAAASADGDMRAWDLANVPLDSIAVRVMTLAELQQAGICTGSNTYGGCNSGAASTRRALTTLHEPDATYAPHEIGHAYGMFHINLPPGTRLRTGLMAGPSDAGVGSATRPSQLSDTEIRAIQALQTAGVRAGTTRGQMKSIGLINR